MRVKTGRGTGRRSHSLVVSESVVSGKYTVGPKLAPTGSFSLLSEKDAHEEGAKWGFCASFYGAKRRHFRTPSAKVSEDVATFVQTLLLYALSSTKL